MERMRFVIAWIIWRVTYGVMYFFLLFTRVQVFYDKDSLKELKKPLILISNHRGIMDPWYISFSFPYSIFFKNVFPLRPYSSVNLSEKNVIGRILKYIGIMRFIYFIYNTIETANTDSFEEKIAPLINALNKKHSVLMFPEGRLVSNDSILEFKKGVVKIHEKTKAPILPIAIKYKKVFFPFYKILVNIGKTVDIPEEMLRQGEQDEYKEAREYLRKKVVDLYVNMG